MPSTKSRASKNETHHRETSHPVLRQSYVKKNYGFLAFVFTGGVILISILVAYFAFTKTTIILTPKPQDVSMNFSLNLSDISGIVETRDGEKEKSAQDQKLTRPSSIPREECLRCQPWAATRSFLLCSLFRADR